MHVHDTFGAVRPNDAVIDSKGPTGPQLLEVGFAGYSPFVRVEQIEKSVVPDFHGRIQPENAERFLRPARGMTRPIVTARQVNFPAAHVSEPLSESEIGLALPNLFVGLMLFRHIGRHYHASSVAGESERT